MMRRRSRQALTITAERHCAEEELQSLGQIAHGTLEALSAHIAILDPQGRAEGVELPDQVKELQRLGYSSAQGYHFSKPVRAEALGTLLQGFPRYHSIPGLSHCKA